MVPTSAARRLRLSRLSEEAELADLEGVVMVPGPNMAYYTGVRAQLLERPFLLLVKRTGEAHLLCPRLEAGPFRESGIDMVIHDWVDSEGPGAAFKRLFAGVDTRRDWGCEGRVPFGFVNHLQRRGMKLKPADALLQSIRAVKEPAELEALRRSAKILVGAYLKVPELLREGIRERELSRLLVEEALALGAESTEMAMVQSGPRSADPHSDASLKKIKKGESVVIDAVSFYEGYAADITRTFCLGKNQELERIYSCVLEAQEEAIEAAKEGVMVGKVDAAARGSLARAGLGDRFIHRTGHGLGLEVHEAPYIVSSGRERLQAGMVFTVEPGAYLPNELGVRIEDDLAATSGGRDVLTRKLPKEYGWWR